MSDGQEHLRDSRPKKSTKNRAILYLFIGFLTLGVLGAVASYVASRTGPRVEIEECYFLDKKIVSVDTSGERHSEVGLVIRTKPNLNELDAMDLFLVVPDGRHFGGRIEPIGGKVWLLFAIPEEFAARSGLKLRHRSSRGMVDLPQRIESRDRDHFK